MKECTEGGKRKTLSNWSRLCLVEISLDPATWSRPRKAEMPSLVGKSNCSLAPFPPQWKGGAITKDPEHPQPEIRCKKAIIDNCILKALYLDLESACRFSE